MAEDIDSMTVEDMIDEYLMFADEVRKCDDQRKTLKKAMDKIIDKVSERADAQGVKQFKTDNGIAFKKKGFKIYVKVWAEALDFMIKNDLTHMLTRSVSKNSVKEFMDANNNQVPPGLSHEPEVKMYINKSR